MYGHLLYDSVECDLVRDAIRHDDVDAIHRLFQDRRCGPLDWLVWKKTPREESLLAVSVHLPMSCGSEVVAAVC